MSNQREDGPKRATGGYGSAGSAQVSGRATQSKRLFNRAGRAARSGVGIGLPGLVPEAHSRRGVGSRPAQ
jgi:hypothetical protein